MSNRFADREDENPDAKADSTAGQETSADASSGTKDDDGVAGEIERLQGQISEKDREIAELKDKYLRALAESDNVRKRVRQQSEESIRLQRENLLRELLPLIDNLERAVGAAKGGGNGHSIVEGVELVLRGAVDFLKAQGVVPLNVVGEPFDPSRHEAVDHVDSHEHPANTVVDEFHRGYLIGERMLRPARVSVARSRHGKESGNGDVDDGGKAGGDGDSES
ncbi:MAG TPA: nucleotide exchange factor GrpE [Candidatus Binataceae bacterium]|nr:nucleotide exchange factor GrpE [Candidatus Binataceae bacterium]